MVYRTWKRLSFKMRKSPTNHVGIINNCNICTFSTSTRHSFQTTTPSLSYSLIPTRVKTSEISSQWPLQHLLNSLQKYPESCMNIRRRSRRIIIRKALRFSQDEAKSDKHFTHGGYWQFGYLFSFSVRPSSRSQAATSAGLVGRWIDRGTQAGRNYLYWQTGEVTGGRAANRAQLQISKRATTPTTETEPKKITETAMIGDDDDIENGFRCRATGPQLVMWRQQLVEIYPQQKHTTKKAIPCILWRGRTRNSRMNGVVNLVNKIIINIIM